MASLTSETSLSAGAPTTSRYLVNCADIPRRVGRASMLAIRSAGWVGGTTEWEVATTVVRIQVPAIPEISW